MVIQNGMTWSDYPDLLLRPLPSDQDESDDSDTPSLPLDSLEFVKAYTPVVDQARDAIIQEMETMVVNGLAELVSLEIC